MSTLFVQLLPEMIGLVITPAAVVACILLLQSARPLPNSLSFAAGFLAQCSLVALAGLLGGATRAGATDTDVRDWVGTVIGVLFLLGGLVLAVRRPKEQRAPRWVAALHDVTPRRALLAGVGVGLFNPNIAILLSGISVISAADVSAGVAVAAAVALVAACALDFAVPIGIYLALGDRGRVLLDRLQGFLVRHNRALSAGVLLVFGVVFTGRGIGGILD